MKLRTEVECACGAWGSEHCDCTGLRWRWVSDWQEAGPFFYDNLRNDKTVVLKRECDLPEDPL